MAFWPRSKFLWMVGGHAILDQMVTEPNLWRIQCAENSSTPWTSSGLCGRLVGHGRFRDSGCNYQDHSNMRWETSEPEEINAEAGVRFLGTELYNKDGRWWMTQSNYIIDLLNRNLGSEPDLSGLIDDYQWLLKWKQEKIRLARI